MIIVIYRGVKAAVPPLWVHDAPLRGTRGGWFPASVCVCVCVLMCAGPVDPLQNQLQKLRAAELLRLQNSPPPVARGPEEEEDASSNSPASSPSLRHTDQPSSR